MSSFLHKMMMHDVQVSVDRRQPKHFQRNIRWAYRGIAPRAILAALDLVRKGASIEHIERALQNDYDMRLEAYDEITDAHKADYVKGKALPCLNVDGVRFKPHA